MYVSGTSTSVHVCMHACACCLCDLMVYWRHVVEWLKSNCTACNMTKFYYVTRCVNVFGDFFCHNIQLCVQIICQT